MFKKLREKLADEVRQSPLRMPGTFTFGNPTLQAVGEVKEQEFPGDGLSNEQQFSITEDDGTSSEMGSPQRDLNATASSSKVDDLDSSLFVPVLDNHNAARSTYIPPSDLESEVEDRIQTPPTLDDSISKEQLFLALTKLHARVQRYKTKYSKVAEACKTANAEKEKIMKTLATNQDQMLRRMSELREQCNLEKQAKAHLEENLRLMLDEKEDMIGVLKTKIDLLKGGQNPDLIDEDVKSTKSIDSFSISEDQDCDKKSVRSQDDSGSKDSESITVLENKVKRLEELLSRCKNALQSNKERSEQLTLERDRLADQLEQKEQELLKIQEEESSIQANLRTELSEMSERLNKLRKEQEEMGMAMAETKRSFHQELETREQRLSDTQKDLNKAKEEINKIQQQWQDENFKVQNLTAELEKMEKTLDEEKNELIQKLSESKSAAIILLKEQHQKSLTEIEDEWKCKVEEAEQKYVSLAENEKENSTKLTENNAFVERLKEETSVTVSELNQEIEKLRDELNLKSENLTDQSSLQDEVGSLQAQLEDLKRDNEWKKKEFEKLNEENQNLKSFETYYKEIKLKYSDMEQTLTTSNNELQTILEDKNNLSDELFKLSTVKERLNEITATNTNLNNFVNAIEDHTMPLFNKFDDLKLDKNDLLASSASLKNAVERFSTENSNMVDKIQYLTNQEIRWKELVEKLNVEKEGLNDKLESESKKFNDLQSEISVLKSTSASLNEIQSQLISSQSEIDKLRDELNTANVQLEKSTQDYEKLRFKYDETVSCNECKEIEVKKELDILRSSRVDKDNHIDILNERCTASENEILNLKTSLEGKDANLTEIRTKLKEIESEKFQLENLLTELKDKNQKVIEVNTKEVDKLKDDIATNDGIISSLQEKSGEFQSEIQNLRNMYETESANANKFSSLLEKAISERDKLIKAIDEGSSGNETLSRELEITKNKIHQLEAENIEKSKTLLQMETQVKDLNSQLNETKSELMKGIEERNTLLNELETTKSRLEQLEAENIEKLNQLLRMDSQIIDLNTQLNLTKGDLMKALEGSSGNETMKYKIHNLEAENADKLNKLVQMEYQINNLNAELNESHSQLSNLSSRISDLELEKNKLQSECSEKSEQAETIEIKLQESVNLIEKYSKDLELNEEKISELEEECLQLRDNNSESQCIIQKLDTIRSELNDLQREKSELESTFAERCELHENEKTRAANKITELRAQIDELENLGSVSEERCHELEVQVSSMDKQNKETEIKFSEQSETIQRKNMELEHLTRTNEEIKSQFDLLKSGKHTLESEKDNTISELTEDCAKLTQENRNLEECILKTEATLKVKNDENSVMESKIAQYESELLGLKSSLQELKASKEYLNRTSSEYEKLKQHHDELRDYHARLEKQFTEQEDNLRTMNETLTSTRQACGVLETNLQERETSYNLKAEEVENFRRHLNEKNIEIEAYGIKLARLMDRNDELEKCLNDVDEKRSKIENSETEILELKAKLMEASVKHDEALKQKEEIFEKEIQTKEDLIESLQEDIKLRNIQLDECLVVSEANTSGITQELEVSKEKLEELTKENSVLKRELSENPANESAFETSLLENVTLNNDEDYETRLKKLVKYFSAQMKKKEEEYEKEMADIKERYMEVEEKLVYEKDQNVTGIEKRLAEQSSAIEEMREHFLIQIQEKDEIIMMLQKENNIPPKSDWDNNWEYEEESADNVAGEDTVRHKNERELKQSTKSETMSTNISVCANGTDSVNRNTFGDLTIGLEPTEYLYLRNILLEYMMGKEPVTLAKVIAAVLRFPKDLTSQILKREEARQHSTITTPSPDS